MPSRVHDLPHEANRKIGYAWRFNHSRMFGFNRLSGVLQYSDFIVEQNGYQINVNFRDIALTRLGFLDGLNKSCALPRSTLGINAFDVK